MRAWWAVPATVAMVTAASAQQPYDPYQQQQQYPQQQQPYQQPQQQQPYQQQPYQQAPQQQPQYPQQNPYPQPAQYPQRPQYPQQPQPGAYAPAPPSSAPPATPAAAAKPKRLLLMAKVPEAVVLTWRCSDLIDVGRLKEARGKCAEALVKDDGIALLHALMATLHPAEVAETELQRAVGLAKNVSPAERTLVEALRATVEGRGADAGRLYDELTVLVPDEPRVWVARGRFRRATNLEAAMADFQHAAELGPKLGAVQGLLAGVLLERRQLDPALQAGKRYVELSPDDAVGHLTLARVYLARGDARDAEAAAKKAVSLDDKLSLARQIFGDVLLFAQKGKEARAQYAVLAGSADGPTHHDGAMREARSWVFDSRAQDAEKALLAESELAARGKRPADQVSALVELARVQLDRAAVSDAGQSLRQAGAVLAERVPGTMTEAQRLELGAEVLHVRAMVLAAVGERQLAEARVAELLAMYQQMGDPQAQPRAAALRGWIAARNRDDKVALVELASATRPTLRLAYALALGRAGQPAQAETVMRELAARTENDLEGALTRPRAQAWLKQQKLSPKAVAAPAPVSAAPVAAPAAPFVAPAPQSSSLAPLFPADRRASAPNPGPSPGLQDPYGM